MKVKKSLSFNGACLIFHVMTNKELCAGISFDAMNLEDCRLLMYVEYHNKYVYIYN